MTIDEAQDLVAEVVKEALEQSNRADLPEIMETNNELYIHGEFWDEDGEQEVYASLKVELI